MAALTLGSKAAVSFRTQNVAQRPSRRNCIVTRAALDPSAALAVSQQTAAFAAVVGAEAAFTGLNTPSTTPGRPSIPVTLAGVAGTLVGAGLISQGDTVGTIGCAVSLLTAAFMMTNYIGRVKDTPFDPNDWPGAKAWPAVMILISFFEFAASFQGAQDGLSLLRQVSE